MRPGHWPDRAGRGASVVLGLWGALLACPAFAQSAAATCDADDVAAVAAIATSGVVGGAAAAVPVDRLVAQSCKPWPNDAAIRLAAIAFAGDAESVPGERDLELRVAMLDAASGKVLAFYAQAMGEDAAFELAADSLRLDTARYDLAKGVRAIGVVVHSAARGPSCPDFYSNQALTLLVREGRSLRPVLQRDLYAWQRVKGEPCSLGKGDVITEVANLSVSMAPQVHAGYADIVLTANVATVESAAGSDTDTERTRRVRQVLRYDGQRYVPVAGGDPSWPFDN
ncbi:hypothetical protein VB145_07815 [Xanthomonas arboricola]|uniref:Secreted protein n=1 Tax=Xanthomonas campestris pv. juglandis TaxID=195709 RepID=A0A7U7HN88_XANCJ|nr:hypothetical protein [Xanthomonas arboricola]AKU48680.1 hypothetical protein AKJ12_01980 [Xanthomonas arboricola pv. juglandis]KOA97245.1 hypothetical protein AE921_17705 [Xanthomonas arboricola]KOA99807.1 hypothetical protein AE920_11400 [Xanthomonas arboricola]KOB10028.1 hypothetical protein AE922_05740 [Xanthomonas arboricola]KOB12102.1 hypothetical protein AE923_01665 [Xanthomonas arboricola]